MGGGGGDLQQKRWRFWETREDDLHGVSGSGEYQRAELMLIEVLINELLWILIADKPVAVALRLFPLVNFHRS